MALRRGGRWTVLVAALILSACSGGVDSSPEAAAPAPDPATASAKSSATQKPAKPKPAPKPSAKPTAKPSAKPAAKPAVDPAYTALAAKNAEGFVPVVTDRIPTPKVPIGINDPVPGFTNMQPPARTAFEKACAAERKAGLAPVAYSAWRSAAWQQVLFDRAVTKYGSAAEANKWVLQPNQSAHVKGYAVDVHPQSAAACVQKHGASYGLCRIYANEWWHFEYRATTHCLAVLANAVG